MYQATYSESHQQEVLIQYVPDGAFHSKLHAPEIVKKYWFTTWPMVHQMHQAIYF
jgi:hypothetical protein